MFSKHTLPISGFESSWKTNQQLSENETQTEEVKCDEKENQVVNLEEKEVQTEPEEVPNYGAPEYNVDTLVSFLEKVTPLVEQELKKVKQSRAFDGYSFLDDGLSTGVKKLHTLRWKHLLPEGEVSGIGWSCTGSVVGVTFGVGDHEDWCTHKGALTIWNINRSDFDANQPERTIETSSCLTNVSFHPTNPAIVAVSSVRGEILVYNLSQADEELTPLSGENEGSGSISSIIWVPIIVGRTSNQYFLVSASTNGKILVWNHNARRETLAVTQGYFLSDTNMPKSVRTKLNESGGLGVSAASFNSEDPTLFVLGGEGGGIYLCSTLSQAPAGVQVEDIDLLDCVTSPLASHTGRILVLQCSPHHRNALLSAATDNEIRLSSLLQPNKPVMVIYCEHEVLCGTWSPSRCGVAAIGLNTGEVVLYNLLSKGHTPLLTLPAPEKPSPITTVTYNQKNMALVAVGDKLGRVNLWQLPTEAVSPVPSELSTLNNLLTAVAD
ncbi:cytoplasmic dynein 2 intermediate chain 2-like [Oratosquilla oratoria]|uniref:cytoplasmic dynein 2 intermediate chain 2-like n=1 Tax=Oratosquilla oratoria TaxID=337810 RepID=UPI003F764CBD